MVHLTQVIHGAIENIGDNVVGIYIHLGLGNEWNWGCEGWVPEGRSHGEEPFYSSLDPSCASFLLFWRVWFFLFISLFSCSCSSLVPPGQNAASPYPCLCPAACSVVPTVEG